MQCANEKGVITAANLLRMYEKNDLWENVTERYILSSKTFKDYNCSPCTKDGLSDTVVLFVQTWGADSRYRPDTEATGQIGALLEMNEIRVVHASRFFLEGDNVGDLKKYEEHFEWWIEHVCTLINKENVTHVCIQIYDNTIYNTIQLMKKLRNKFGEEIKIILGGSGASSFSAAEKRLGFSYGLWGNPALYWLEKSRPLHDILVTSPNGHRVLLEILKNPQKHYIWGTEKYMNGSIIYNPKAVAPEWNNMPILNVRSMLSNFPIEKKERHFHSFTVHQECPSFWSGCVNFCGGQRGVYLNVKNYGYSKQSVHGVASEKIAADMLALINDAKTNFLYPSVPDITPRYIIEAVHSAIMNSPELRQKAKNKEFKMGSFVRMSNLMESPQEYISKFRDINLTEVYVGFENLKFWVKTKGNQTYSESKVQEYIENAENCMKLLSSYNINVEVNTCFGFPGETVDDAMYTVNWINNALETGVLSKNLTMTSYSDLHNLEIPYSAYTKKYLDQLNETPQDILYRVGTDYPPLIFTEMVNQGRISLDKLCKPYTTVERHILPRLSTAVRNKMISLSQIPNEPYGQSKMSFRQMVELLANYAAI